LLFSSTNYQICRISLIPWWLMKSYGQRCPLARGLDVIGDRWTLLVIRELLLGPRRYTDLLDGLPGVGTNILAARLADLQAAQVITRRTLPPPTAVTVYELAEAGEALRPAINALSGWGEQYGAPANDAQAARPAWILLGALRRGIKLEPGRSCELRVGRDAFALTGTPERPSVVAGSAQSPDAVITLEPDLLYALATRRMTPRAVRRHIEIEGDRDVAEQVLTALSGAAASSPTAAARAPS
jgi:DNA-binding HxlR family transcriptional regulator